MCMLRRALGCPYARAVPQCAARRPRQTIRFGRHVWITYGKPTADVDAAQGIRMSLRQICAAVRSEATAADDTLRAPFWQTHCECGCDAGHQAHVWAAVRSEATAEMWLLYSAPGCPHARSASQYEAMRPRRMTPCGRHLSIPYSMASPLRMWIGGPDGDWIAWMDDWLCLD